jgi:hypothetical protein
LTTTRFDASDWAELLSVFEPGVATATTTNKPKIIAVTVMQPFARGACFLVASLAGGVGGAAATAWPQLGQNAAPSGTAAPQLVQFMLKSPRTTPSGERIAPIERKNKLAVTGMNPVTLVLSV